MTEDLAALWEKYPVELDGWCLGHRMLIDDQQKIKDASEAFLAQVNAGIALDTKQRSAFLNFFMRWSDFLHHHHHVEEDVMFPYLCDQKGMQQQPKISEDHKHFIEQLDKCTDHIKAVAGEKQTLEQDAASLKELLDVFTALDAGLKEHYGEEEATIIPAIRQTITPEEQIKHLNKPIVAGFGWKDHGQYFSKFEDGQFQKFAAQERIPLPARWVIKFVFVKLYNRNFVAPLDLAVGNAKAAAEKSATA